MTEHAAALWLMFRILAKWATFAAAGVVVGWLSVTLPETQFIVLICTVTGIVLVSLFYLWCLDTVRETRKNADVPSRGAVRDEILGVPSKDVDFVVVLDDSDYKNNYSALHADPFDAMVFNLRQMGFKIFLETPEYLTVRAQFPKTGEFQSIYVSPGRHGLTADFVLARKESGYTDGRRPDVVEPGTLMDDLSRRDFTMNAIAKDSEGNYIDPFLGQTDIALKIIRTVGDPHERFEEDALRAVRALRFSVTKGFRIHGSVEFAMQSAAVLDAIENKISDERIKDELSKMFRFDTLRSLQVLNEYSALTRAMFSGTVSLDATMKTKGRGK